VPGRRALLRSVEIGGGQLAYTVAEAVRQCRVSKSSLYEELRAGRLRGVMRCGRRLILHDDLVAWLRGDGPG
jgi:excisionase family DNA binding protein